MDFGSSSWNIVNSGAQGLQEATIVRTVNMNAQVYNPTILQMGETTSRDKNREKGIEWLRTYIASLESKLNTIVEELNNLYETMLAEIFHKRADAQNTAKLLNKVRGAAFSPTFDVPSPHPAGPRDTDQNGTTIEQAAGMDIVPYDAYIRNYTYNPYFGSRAMDLEKYFNMAETKSNDVARTYYERYNGADHHEFGASAFATIGYLWLWDVDRINASYATSMDRFIDADGVLHVPTYDPLVSDGSGGSQAVDVDGDGEPDIIPDSSLDILPDIAPYNEDFEAYNIGIGGINQMITDGWYFGGDATAGTAPDYGWRIMEGGTTFTSVGAADVYGNGTPGFPGGQGHALVQTTNSNAAFAFGGTDTWDDYSLEGTIGKVNGDNDETRIWFRHNGTDDQNGYYFHIQWADSGFSNHNGGNTFTVDGPNGMITNPNGDTSSGAGIGIRKVVNGAVEQLAWIDRDVSSLNFPAEAGGQPATGLRVRVDVFGDDIRVYLGQVGDYSADLSFDAPPNPPQNYVEELWATDSSATKFSSGKLGLSSSSQSSWFDDLKIRGVPPSADNLQVNVTALQPNRGVQAAATVGDRIALDTSSWAGFSHGDIAYDDAWENPTSSGYKFTPEVLYLEVYGKDPNGKPLYKVVKQDGTEPMMEVLTGVTQQTINLPDFGTYNAGAMAAGGTAFGGWVNRTGETISSGAGASSGYWHQRNLYGGNGGGATSVSYDLNFAKPILQGASETVNISGVLYADDGWTINTAPGAFPGMPASWSTPYGDGGGRIATTPDLSGAIDYGGGADDTDGTWTRVWSQGAGLPGTGATKTTQASVTSSPFSVNTPASGFAGQQTAFLVTAIDGDPAGWAGGNATASGLWAQLSVAGRQLDGTMLVPRYVVDDYGNIRDRFGIAGYGTYGHSGGSNQITNANSSPDSPPTPPDATGGDDELLYDYVPHHDLIDNNLTIEDLDVVGSLESDFFYYREALDEEFVYWNDANGDGVVQNNQANPEIQNYVDDETDNNRPNISFDPRRTNLQGKYTVDNGRIYITNTDTPTFGDTVLTYVEQDPNVYNSLRGGDAPIDWNTASTTYRQNDRKGYVDYLGQFEDVDKVTNNGFGADDVDDYLFNLAFMNQDHHDVGILSAIQKVSVTVTGEPTIQNKQTMTYDSLNFGGGVKPVGLDMTWGYFNNVLQNGGGTLINNAIALSEDVENNPLSSGWTYNDNNSGVITWREHTNTANSGAKSFYFGNAAGNSYSLGPDAPETLDIYANWDVNEMDMGIVEPGGTGAADPTNPAYVYFGNLSRYGSLDGDGSASTNVPIPSPPGAGAWGSVSDEHYFVAASPATAGAYEIWLDGVVGSPFAGGDVTYVIVEDAGTPRGQVQSWATQYVAPSTKLKIADFNLQPSQRVSGELISPAFNLTGYNAASLSFYDSFEVETDMPDLYDFKNVYISPDGGTTWNQVLQKKGVSSQTWQQNVIDLAPYIGQTNVKVKFEFDSMDGRLNDFRGWNIDDIEVSGTRTNDLYYTDNEGNANFKLHINPDMAAVNDATVQVNVDYVEDLNRDGIIDAAEQAVTRTATYGLSDAVRFQDADVNGMADADTNHTIGEAVYDNYLVLGDGRSGGADVENNVNRLTKRLKQILDSSEYKDVIRFGLLNDDHYLAATVSDNRGDQIVGKLIINWDWRRRRVKVKQGAFSAVYKA